MKFEDYFGPLKRDTIIEILATTPLCPNVELIDGCRFHPNCKECWEYAIINSDLAEYERRRNESDTY